MNVELMKNNKKILYLRIFLFKEHDIIIKGEEYYGSKINELMFNRK